MPKNVEIHKKFEEWMSNAADSFSDGLRNMSDHEICDAFYQDLAFGTGGLRGKLGIGSNRLNTYTIGKCTQGLADYLNEDFGKPSVVICHDTRHKGDEFVRVAACILAANDIETYVFPRVEPTPVLSFAVRELGCSAGINITASHNPAEYSGYKVYGTDGCQITVECAEAIQSAIDAVDIFTDVKSIGFDEAVSAGIIKWVEDSLLDIYINKILELSTDVDCSNLGVVYTPLHGVGLECMRRMFEEVSVGELHIVKEQAVQDGDFPTCPSPNPELRSAFDLALRIGDQVRADILIASDPDADRMGAAVMHNGEYEFLTGNEIGVLFLDYLSKRTAKSKRGEKVACSTIVSTPLADSVAHEYGIELRRTLTGFKFIGEQIGFLAQEGREQDFLFGFEESYGYLIGTNTRDKDAIVATMLFCEMTAFYKQQGKTLFDVINSIYEKHGYWVEARLSVGYEGAEGSSFMDAIMEQLRSAPPSRIGNSPVKSFIDYEDSVQMPVINGSGKEQNLPSSNVMEFRFNDDSRIIFRPSGTEPKVKAYLFANYSTKTEAEAILEPLIKGAQEILEGSSL